MLDVFDEAYLLSLSNSDLDAEAREVLGDEEYNKLMQQVATRESIITAVIAKQKAGTTNRQYSQKSLFDSVDGKTAAAGPDK